MSLQGKDPDAIVYDEVRQYMKEYPLVRYTMENTQRSYPPLVVPPTNSIGDKIIARRMWVVLSAIVADDDLKRVLDKTDKVKCSDFPTIQELYHSRYCNKIRTYIGGIASVYTPPMDYRFKIPVEHMKNYISIVEHAYKMMLGIWIHCNHGPMGNLIISMIITELDPLSTGGEVSRHNIVIPSISVIDRVLSKYHKILAYVMGNIPETADMIRWLYRVRKYLHDPYIVIYHLGFLPDSIDLTSNDELCVAASMDLVDAEIGDTLEDIYVDCASIRRSNVFNSILRRRGYPKMEPWHAKLHEKLLYPLLAVTSCLPVEVVDMEIVPCILYNMIYEQSLPAKTHKSIDGSCRVPNCPYTHSPGFYPYSVYNNPRITYP